MRVISCNRRDCHNIMSEYHVPGAGDICRECMAEFKEYAKGVFPPIDGEYGVEQALKSFMHKPKMYLPHMKFDINAWAQQFSRHK